MPPSPAFIQLLTDHVLGCAERQQRARGVIGAGDCAVDLVAGTIAFAGGPELACSVLGSGSAQDDGWYWAWGNRGLGLDDDRLRDAGRVRHEGERLEVPELTEARLTLAPEQPVSLPGLAIVASSLCDAGAYYIAENPPYSVVLALHSPLLALPALDPNAFTSTILASIGMFETPHLVDDDPYGVLAAGGELSLQLATGTHDVQLALDDRRSGAVPILIAPGERTSLTAQPAADGIALRRGG